MALSTVKRIKSILSISLSVICLWVLYGCSTVHVNSIQPPLPTARLRVYVQPLSSQNVRSDKPFGKRRNWSGTTNDEFRDNQREIVRDYLEDLGYYEVVGSAEVQAALGDGEETLTRTQMENDNWALAKQIGKALHADYVMVMERAKQTGTIGTTEFLFTNVLINVENGKQYGSSFRIEGNTRADYKDRHRGVRATYRQIFRKAKDDMLTTAMRKAEKLTGTNTSAMKQKAVTAAPAPQPGGEQRADSDWKDKINGDEGLFQAAPAGGSARVVVYDLEAPPQYKPASLIITEALREEIYRLKRFTLVNRENLEQILKEMALQQTGLVDEKEAVKMGKGLAANQVVTGQLGLLGKTFVLQAKRIDVESFATLGLASAKFEQGSEDNVFQQLPDFAKHLSGL